MILYHSGMEGMTDLEISHYININIMTTFFTCSKGKKPKLLSRIKKYRNKKERSKADESKP